MRPLTRIGGVIAALVCALTGNAEPTVPEIQAIYREKVRAVDIRAIESTFQEFAAIGNRMAGSKGEAAAFALAERKMRSLGLENIRKEPFTVTIPDPEARGRLTVGGRSVEVFPLWPNLVRTSTCDVEGPLLYGGSGTMEALDGKPVEGSIVILEFNSGSRWKNAAKLGAKGIVFLEPDTMPRAEAEQKFAAVGIDVPRFYLPLDRAAAILAAAREGRPAHLSCRQDWVKRQSMNLLADLPGTEPQWRRERVLISARADASALIPALAPGADSLSGLAAMFEMARVLKASPPKRPVTFMVSGAHMLAMQGTREFIERRLQRPDDGWFLNLDLDLSSGSQTLGGYGRGWYYEYRDETEVQVDGISRLLRRHMDRLAPVMGVGTPRLLFTDATNNSDNRTWKNNIPGKFAFACETYNLANMNGLTLATIEDARARTETPFDTLDQVDVSNVWRQCQTLAAILHHILNDTSSVAETSDHRVPLEVVQPKRMTLIGGFTVAQGAVVAYDPQASFVPDVRIDGSIAVLAGKQKTLMGVRGDQVQLTDEKARFRFFGIPPQSAYYPWQEYSAMVRGYRLDPATGEMEYGPDSGPNGYNAYPIDFVPKTAVRESPIVVFPCVATNMFDLVDPHELKAIGGWDVREGNSDGEPRSYGLEYAFTDMRLTSEIEDSAVLLTMKDARVKLLLRGSRIGAPKLILTNSKIGDEAGTGYGFRGPKIAGSTERGDIQGKTFQNLPLNAAKDIWAINETRVNRFEKYRIISPGIRDLQAQAKEQIDLADAAIAKRQWSAAERHARAAWGYALRAHPIIQQTAADVVNGVVFYLFLIIPFAYFLERLLIGHRSLTRQLGAAGAIFLGAFILLRLIHPAFEIVTNPTMIFVGFVMGALSLIVATFVLGKFETSLRQLKAQQSGVHEVDIRRMSVALAAFNLGVSNMRRRKARTFLTTLTLVVMTFIVLSFTSIVNDLRLVESSSENLARYPGIMIRNAGLEPMPNSTYRQLSNEFAEEGSVVRRVFYYGADVGDNGVLTLQRADRSIEVRAMLGLEPDEQNLTRPQEALLPGGRWFRPGDRNVILLPTPLAESLKIAPEDVGKASVTFAGVNYTVVGLLDASILRSVSDLDGDGILPADFSLSRAFQTDSNSGNEAFRSFIRLEPSVCFILPAETAMALGGDIRGVAVGFKSAEATRKGLEDLMPRFKLNLYASVLKEGAAADAPVEDRLQVRQFSAQQGSKSTGLGLVIIQLIIASVFVLNTMVATVFERTKEISIFSAIGLAPNHIAMLFFAESLVYGVMGAVSGYFLAQGMAKLIIVTGILPGLFLNFSSSSAVLSAGLVMAVVLGSTIYPARKAARIAAPAMDDDPFQSEPEGDRWNLSLPFSIGTAEAKPLVRFLGEWLKAYEEYTIGEFVSSNTRVRQEGDSHIVEATTWLAPYDLGVAQELRLSANPTDAPGIYSLDLEILRSSGDPENWIAVNRRFLEVLRKQFLTWRTLGPEQRRQYLEEAKEPAAV